jgi:hypothetical protein
MLHVLFYVCMCVCDLSKPVMLMVTLTYYF